MSHGATRFTVGLLVLLGAVGLTRCRRTEPLPADVTEALTKLPASVRYTYDVKPILSDRCFACHGPDAGKRQASLRLDEPESAHGHQSEETGWQAILPGDPNASDLVQRILSTDPKQVMPTPESHLSLTAQEKAVLIRWIEQGAAYEPHWAFTSPQKPAVPTGRQTNWVKTPLDRWVLAKLEANGLKPSPEADKITLLRRVSLDLTGLPPTVAEVETFLKDTSPNAYEKVVDRLLASPHFGEHQAASWLDLARYADTHGYQLDVPRTAWPYRDWVINAFNRNLRFDQFVTWQLAGDLLPNPTREQRLATCFNRLHPQNQEGGIVEEEYRTEYVADRVNTFGKAFLGLTVECARCHDHKYDPISQRDYFSLFAFFNQVNEAGQVPYLGESSPTMLLTDAAAARKLAHLRQKIAAKVPELNPAHARYDAPFRRWLATGAPSTRRGRVGSYALNDTARYAFANAAQPKVPAGVSGDREKPPVPVPGRFGRGRVVNGEGHLDLGKSVGFFERHQPFALSLWVNLRKKGLRGPVFSRSNGLDNGNRGYECLLHPDGILSFDLNHNYPASAIEVRTGQPLPVGRWVHLAMSYDGSGTAAGTRLFVDGTPVRTRVMADGLRKSLLFGPGRTNSFGLFDNFRVGGKFRDSMADFWVDELNVWARPLTALELREQVRGWQNLDAIGRRRYPRLKASERAMLREFYVLNHDSAYAATAQALERLRAEETTTYDAQPEVMVMADDRLRVTHLLKRGVYDAPGEVVPAQTPSVLGAFPEQYPRTRLGLAQWLLSEENPLFARVMVNRFWQNLFGQGLVESSDDWGNQGKLPSHPELLDYLSVEFRRSRWNVKMLLKQIVLSATYRQNSRTSDELREIDPDNRLLARGTAYRLSAEQARDNALAVSGLLIRQIGGPSVYPYQPAGVWEALSTLRYPQQHGADLYRRSMYTFWKRTAPHPALLIFDASERHQCTIRRQKTSTPLQALVTLNDPQFVEAARVLAGRVMHDTHLTDEDQIQALMRQVISREARPTELRWLRELLDETRTDFARHLQRARQLTRVGEAPVDAALDPIEWASWTVLASTLLNHDEALIRR
jgi:hypothetical protein